MKSLSFLIDTDWAIDHFNGIAQVTRRLQELEPQGLALSIISSAELWEGAYFSRGPKRSQAMLEEFLAGVVILIAATALRHNLTLLTNNRKHFEAVSGLHIESV